MDLDEPYAKRRKVDTGTCIICFKTLNHKSDPVVKNPTSEGLKAIIDACELKKDNVFEALWPLKEEILGLKLKVTFHKSCRAKYTSKSNFCKSNSNDAGQSTSTCITPSRLSRTETGGFDIRTECFICGKPNTARNKLSSVSTGTGSSTRENVLQAAVERHDTKIQMRMISFPDLFAFDAKYHRVCYSHYISERNIVSAQRKSVHVKSRYLHDEAFEALTKHLNETIFSTRKTVTTLVSLKAKFGSILVELGEEHSPQYSAWKLKERLTNHYGDKLVCVSFDGRTDIICSSSVSLGDALKKATTIHDVEYEELANEPPTLPSDERHILYAAAGILRNHIDGVPNASDVYAPAEDTTIQKCTEIVPDSMYDFMEWCVNEQAYTDMISCGDEGVSKSNLKTIALCHNMISQSQRIFTTITLDLALQVHHECGNKNLINLLHSLGHSVSYDEVRRFLTSVAVDEANTEDGVYVPKRLQDLSSIDGMPVIDAAIDNFDQNEATLDGKSTTHAMAAVLFHRDIPQRNDQSIPRLPLKSLSAADRVYQGFDDLQRYNRPAKRPEPPIVVDSSILNIDKESPKFKAAESRDLSWKVSRTTVDGNQGVPSWTASNAFLSERNIQIATTCYLPFIRAPPTDLTTIYTILLRLVNIADKLKQPHILVTADCAIYSKAQQILWNKPPLLDGKVTMRLGGMHLTMAFIASIGKLYGDGGLLSMLVDSDVYASATARLVLQGKQVSRGNKGMKVVLEALFRLYQESFWLWLQRRDQVDFRQDEMDDLVSDIQHAFKSGDREAALQLTEQLESEHITSLQVLQQEFTDVGRTQSATFAYWDTFMQGVGTLLRLLRAERDGLFELHLIAVCETIPWCRAADRSNYVRYLPGYINDMIRLKENQPNTYKYMQDGGFVVRRSQKRFNAVASDQALEQTINREGKSQGGVVGFTLRKGALTRWMATRHITAQYTDAFKELCNGSVNTSSHNHAEHGKTRMKRDEQDVIKVLEYIGSSQNLFDLDSVPNGLVNITTGMVASHEVAEGPGNFLRVAHEMNTAFVGKRLLLDKTLSFWDTDTRAKTPTFADMYKSLTSRKTDKIMVDSEVLFRRLLAVSKQRDVSLEAVLKHELAPIPPSLFNNDGTMRRTTKAELAKKLESTCDEITVLEETAEHHTAYVIDGMALLQSLDESKFNTFNEIGRVVMQRIRSLLASNLGVTSATLIFDRYDSDISIKQMERDRRISRDTCATYVVNGPRKVPNYRHFMKDSTNKAALAEFICVYLTQTAHQLLDEHHSITLAGGFKDGQLVKVIDHTGVQEKPELFSTHEEADTRIILHAIDLAVTHSRIIVRCDDTDVLVLLIHYCGKGMFGNSEVYMNAGHCTKLTNRQRFIPVNIIAAKIGQDVSLCLPAAHAISGCDTTSSLFKIGKRTAYSTLLSNIGDLLPLAHLGQSNDTTHELKTATKYALLLYGSRSNSCTSLD